MASLDMSLDDMIKNRRNSERGRGGGRPRRGRGSVGSLTGGRMTGPPRRDPLRVNAQSSAYTIAKPFRRPKSLPWQRDLFEESFRAAGLLRIENGTKLYVSNLDIGVSNADIRELFSEIGELERYAIHYDKNGRPSGSAEVMYSRRSDAFLALKRYNNVQLDGKPMKIEIAGSNSGIPVSARVNVAGGVNGRRTVVMTQGMGRARGVAGVNRLAGKRSRGGMTSGRGSWGGMNGRGGSGMNGRGNGRGGGRGRGRGRKRNVDRSADDLDKDLETYHAEAMQT